MFMSKPINLNALLGLSGSCLVTTRCVETGEVLSMTRHKNTLFSAWKTALAKDVVNQTQVALPRVMGFSKSVVSASPQPTVLTSEFRASCSVVSSGSTIQIISVLGPSEGNSPSGNIKSLGFYYGTDATLTLATGTLGSLINTIDVPKDSSIEVSFQYDVTFS